LHNRNNIPAEERPLQEGSQLTRAHLTTRIIIIISFMTSLPNKYYEAVPPTDVVSGDRYKVRSMCDYYNESQRFENERHFTV